MMSEEEETPLLLRYNAVTGAPYSTGSSSTEAREIKLYASRWFMLAVVAVLNLSNGMVGISGAVKIWMTFSAVADSVSSYYVITTMQVNWLSIVFMVTTIILGVGAIWLLDKFGFRLSFILSAWLNGVGAGLRIISTISSVRGTPWSYPILLTGQILAGCAQPFIMFAPTKLAALWFGPNERTLANMIGSTANPIGIMLGNILSTAIVRSDNADDISKQIPILLEVFAAPAFLGILMSFGVCSSLPPSPPSTSAAEEEEPFWVGIKQLFHNRSYLILALCYGGGMGLLSTLITVLDQLLCPSGYSDQFSGLCGALLFGVGLAGATVASIIADKTRKHEEVAKISFALAAWVIIGIMIAVNYESIGPLIAVLCSMGGFFGLALNPVCLELSVECTFPVAEGTSAGFLIISGQIQAVIYSILMSINAPTMSRQACEDGRIISIYAVVGFIIIVGILTLAFLSSFRCPYRRLQFEQQLEAEIILNRATARYMDRSSSRPGLVVDA